MAKKDEGAAQQATAEARARRQPNPAHRLIRDVEKAYQRQAAARAAFDKAKVRATQAEAEVKRLIDGAPEAQRSFLQSLASPSRTVTAVQGEGAKVEVTP